MSYTQEQAAAMRGLLEANDRYAQATYTAGRQGTSEAQQAADEARNQSVAAADAVTAALKPSGSSKTT
jgi:hypothetical protein